MKKEKKRQKEEGGARINQFSAEKWNRNVRLVFVYRLRSRSDDTQPAIDIKAFHRSGFMYFLTQS